MSIIPASSNDRTQQQHTNDPLLSLYVGYSACAYDAYPCDQWSELPATDQQKFYASIRERDEDGNPSSDALIRTFATYHLAPSHPTSYFRDDLLCEAVRFSNPDAASYLLKNSANSNYIPPGKPPLLLQAVQLVTKLSPRSAKNATAVVLELLKHNADPHLTSTTGTHASAQMSSLQFVLRKDYASKEVRCLIKAAARSKEDSRKGSLLKRLLS